MASKIVEQSFSILLLNYQVEVVALSSYEEKEEQFKEQVIDNFVPIGWTEGASLMLCWHLREMDTCFIRGIYYLSFQSYWLYFVTWKVANLRQRFFHSIAPGGLAGDRRGVVPASGFSFSAQQIWEVIRQNKDLDLPAHKVDLSF